MLTTQVRYGGFFCFCAARDWNSEQRKARSITRSEPNSGRHKRWNHTRTAPKPDLARQLFIVLSVAALAYALMAGLRTVMDYDLGWQLATGRWVAQHRQIPSTDVFSYTAQGQPWIYPAGAGLLFYAAYLVGKYALLAWLGAAACVGTVALLVWRRSAISATLAILAIPMIALRTTPRAEMFTVVLFAAFLTVLWRQHEGGRTRLWLLPVLMVAWVNLHLGFVAGLALMGGYVLVEALDMVWTERHKAAAERLRYALPWLMAAFAATAVNPWAGGIYRALLRQEGATAAHSQWITEWAPARLNWTLASMSFSLRHPDGAFYVMLLVAAVVLPLALTQRKLGAAVLVSGAALLAIRHIRFQALFAEVVVVVAGAVLTSAFAGGWERIKQARPGCLVAIGLAYCVVGLACVRSADLVSNRSYLASTNLSAFGAGLSWWFPEGAAAFIERENVPGRIFNTYNEGGYLTWRLGPKYPDYIDGRAIPFGPKLFERNHALMATPPDSPEWQREAEQYDINAIIVPLGRYNGVDLFPVLRQFCSSATWRPVYLDEVSAVFARRSTQSESLIQRFEINCATTPLPRVVPAGHDSQAFNQWANAAAVLHALGRNIEAFAATARALGIFENSAFVHFLRGNLMEEAGDLRGAEQEYLWSAALEVNGATWSALGAVYHREGRLTEEIKAWQRAAELLRLSDRELVSLGYAELAAQRPREALRAFERASSQPGGASDNSFLANLARGRAMAWSQLGDLKRAISFQEQTVGLAPDRASDWLELANLYDREQRSEDAQRARQRAAAINRGQKPGD
jgi:tetratricopeptide (TPR) repeat protein